MKYNPVKIISVFLCALFMLTLLLGIATSAYANEMPPDAKQARQDFMALGEATISNYLNANDMESKMSARQYRLFLLGVLNLTMSH